MAASDFTVGALFRQRAEAHESGESGIQYSQRNLVFRSLQIILSRSPNPFEDVVRESERGAPTQGDAFLVQVELEVHLQ